MTGTLFEKLWESHEVAELPGGTTLLYVDRQLLHEVSSPQAFEGLRHAGRGVRRPAAHLAVTDHAVPTRERTAIADPQARSQVALLERNCGDHGIDVLGLSDPRQGIVHVIGPEQGFTLPGTTLVCGDSHTATHGAFGVLAFGIGSSECETVLATQTIRQAKPRTMRIAIERALPRGVVAKDVIMAIIGRIGTNGASGYAVEYAGSAVRALSMEGRMTLCNMTIEAGSRVGLVGPDETTFAYLKGRPLAPSGAAWDQAVDYWRSLASEADALFDRELEIDASTLAPQVTWGTKPDQVADVTGNVPDPATAACEPERRRLFASLDYMELQAGAKLRDVRIDYAFLGSCTNGRIEDLRAAAGILRGRRIAKGVTALAVPGSGLVRAQAEAEGVDRIFIDAGFEWRHAGCSLCVAMNDDRLPAGARSISSSNRNFEGRQGPGARTHLASPLTVAASAVAGRIADPRDFL